MAIVAPGAFFQNLTNHSAQLTRLAATTTPYKPRATGSNLTTTLGSAGGVSMGANSFQVAAQSSPNMSVLVHRGKGVVEGTDSLLQGNYGVYNDADVTLNIATSDPTRLRVDIVYINVRDAAYAGSNNDVRLLVATGNPATGTADESVLPTNSLVLGYVNVRANTTQILGTDIIDRRRFLTANGGVKVTQSFESGDAGIQNGDLRYYQGALQGYDTTGSAWHALNSAYKVKVDSNWFPSGYPTNGANPVTLDITSLSDPGWPYMIECQFNLTFALDTSTRFDFIARDNATNGPEICAIEGPVGTNFFTTMTSYTSWYGPVSGARNVVVMAERQSGTGNLAIDAGVRASHIHIKQVATFPSS